MKRTALVMGVALALLLTGIAPSALAESAQGRGYVIDCAINADEMVHPMVNGGHHITEFLLS